VVKIAVIGLGRFGMSLARNLQKNGAQVIAIDRNINLVNEIKDDIDLAVRLDTTDETALRSQEIDKVDCCVVAIGENFESALLATVIAKRMGVPKIICRAQSKFHAEIFQQIGADDVIQPEIQAGQHLARNLANPHVEDFITLADGYTLIELSAPKIFHDKTLESIGMRTKFGVNLVAIKRLKKVERDGEEIEERVVVSVPKANDQIRSDDMLVLVGSDDALAKLPKE
jgi:trk system potassium uptake protein TrkA